MKLQQFVVFALFILSFCLFTLIPSSNLHFPHKWTKFWTFIAFFVHFSLHHHLLHPLKTDFQQLPVYSKRLFPFSLHFA